MSAYYDAETIASVAIALGSASAIVAWVYRRGRTEGNFEKSMVDNTKATSDLTHVVSGLKNSLDLGFKEVHDRIDTHDVALAQHNITLAVHDRDIMRLQKAVE